MTDKPKRFKQMMSEADSDGPILTKMKEKGLTAPALWKKAKDFVSGTSEPEPAAPVSAPVGKEPAAPASSSAKPQTSAVSSDKPVSVVKTKGGDYNVYAKGSEKAADFRKTYAAAKGNFEWEGRKYAKPSSETTKPATSTAAPLPPKRPEGLGTSSYKPASPQTDKTYNHYAFTNKPHIAGTEPLLGKVKTPSVVGQNDMSSFNSDEQRSLDRQNFDDTRKPVGKFEDPTNAGRYADAELAPAGKGGENYLKATIGTKEYNNRFGAKDQPESESGGKRKKMSEDTNPLIASFLALQEKNPANMFEAAKKAKKDYDKDGKVESPKDEVWGSRFRAAKAAGKMEEAALKDPRDPSVQGSGDVTFKEETELDEVSKSLAGKAIMGRAAKGVDAEYSGDEKSAASHYNKFSKTKERFGKKFGQKSADKMTHAVGMRFNAEETEEVTFSQAEIDHINSFFLEASVAPNRPEVATGADSTSDKMSQNDVTATAESGKSKKDTSYFAGVHKEEYVEETYDAPKPSFKGPANTGGKKTFDKGSSKFVTPKPSISKFGAPKPKQHTASVYAEELELEEGDVSVGGLYDRLVDHLNGENPSRQKAAAVEKAITKVHGEKVMSHLRKAVNANRAGNFDGEMVHIDNARTAAGKSDRIGATVGSGRSEFRRTHEEVELDELYGKGKLDGILRGIETQQNVLNRKAKRAEYLYAASQKNDSNKGADSEKKYYMSKAKTLRKEEVELEEGRPKKNPEPETTDRDPRQHIQVAAGRAAAGNVVDFPHNNGKTSKITPGMGRRITAHLNGLKPADRQSAVNKMHDSPEGLNV